MTPSDDARCRTHDGHIEVVGDDPGIVGTLLGPIARDYRGEDVFRIHIGTLPWSRLYDAGVHWSHLDECYRIDHSRCLQHDERLYRWLTDRYPTMRAPDPSVEVDYDATCHDAPTETRMVPRSRVHRLEAKS